MSVHTTFQGLISQKICHNAYSSLCRLSLSDAHTGLSDIKHKTNGGHKNNSSITRNRLLKTFFVSIKCVQFREVTQ